MKDIRTLRWTNSLPKKAQSILWIMSWALSFNTSMSLAKHLSESVDSFVLVFMRCLFGLILIMPFLAREGLQSLKTTKISLHILRVLFVCCAMAATYYAYRHLPLAFATSIGFTGPLITTFLAMVLLKDKVSWQKWIAIAVGYAGVLLMIRPAGLAFEGAVVIALLANFFAGCGLIVTKKLSKTDSAMTILLFSGVVTTVVSGVFVLFQWKLPGVKDLVLLGFMGVFGTFSQFSYIQALKRADASFVAPFEYSRLIIAIPIGIVIFQEVPSIWTLIGASVIVACTTYLTHLEFRHKTLKEKKVIA